MITTIKRVGSSICEALPCRLWFLTLKYYAVWGDEKWFIVDIKQGNGIEDIRSPEI
jgi:hypothetical protein